MTLIIEDGVGKPDAESYASAADLVMYAGKFGVTIPADEPAQEALLRRSALAMDGMIWKGRKMDSDQALAWPRREVELDHQIKPDNYLPARIQYGQMALAAEIHTDDIDPIDKRKGAVTLVLDPLPADLLNTLVTNVVSAATVDLTSSAPNTRHINIVGTTGVTGFTVAAGKSYFVRFDAALTLTNSALLVTQSGSNITTAAGDTCIIRATAANTVEVLAYTPGLPRELGYRQTQQNMLPSRAINTTYTAPDRLIWVLASINLASGATPVLVIDGRTVGAIGNNGSGANVVNFSFPVNAGITYRINGGTSAAYWEEMR